MRSVQLDMPGLAMAARQLAGQMQAFLPSAVVFVDRAGFLVAQPISRHFGVPLLRATPQRRPRSIKELATPLLPHLPRLLRHQLRKLELQARTAHAARGSTRLPEITFGPQLALLPTLDANILVVDDSVDTGATLFSVCQALQRRLTGCHIRTAALNVWQASTALVKTDYALYQDTLLTTPMSRDSWDYPAFLRLYRSHWVAAATETRLRASSSVLLRDFTE